MDECPVCVETIIDTTSLPCNHWVCRKCIYMSSKDKLKTNNTKFSCPICRHKFNMDENIILYIQYLIRSQKK